MKLKLILSFTALCISMLFTGCSKDDDEDATTPVPTNPVTGALITARINGTAWTPPADSVSGALMNGQINITAIATDGRMITITLDDTITGNYDIGMQGQSAAVYKSSPSSNVSYDSQFGPYDITTNHVNITSIDRANKKMSGTFAFIAHNPMNFNDSVNVTDGSFNNLSYITTIQGGGNSTFNVNINGAAYHPTLIAGVISGNNINIIASANNGNQSVGLYVPTNITVGTYSLQPFGTYNAQYNADAATFMIVSSGTVTITEHNSVAHKIVGTFNFIASQLPPGTQSANLTNGSFTIFYQ